MRLGINACNYNERPAGGTNKFVGIYTKLFQQFPNREYVLYEPEDACIQNLFPGIENVRYVKTPLNSLSTLKRHLKGLNYWRSQLKNDGIDAFEISYLPSVKNPAGKTLLTIHDLRYKKFPEFYSLPRRIFGDQITKNAMRAADMLITISFAMKKEIEELYSPKCPIEVLTPALPLNFSNELMPVSESKKILHRLGIKSPYLLSVGHLEKRKNFLNLLKAFDLLRQKGSEIELIIVGNPTDDLERLLEFKNHSKYGSSIHLLNGISYSELSALYQACELFVFPSVYEGFGIPILEAMNFKRPFVLSNIDVFKEISGGSSVYFDPLNIEDMAEKMQLVLSDSDLNKSLIEIGQQRLKVYDYSQISSHYDKILKSFE